MQLPGWMKATVVAAVTMLGASCGGGSTPPATSDPPGSGERISGTERLGWNQSATDPSQLATFRYAGYVDGTRVELADVSCGGSNGSAFPCTSRMPAMTPGAHGIELASFVVDGGIVIESNRSAVLRVTVAGATAGDTSPASGAPAYLTTADGVHLRLDVLSDQLADVTAIAVAPDGRVFVAEREGRVRVLRNGVLDPRPAIVLEDAVMTSASEGGLLAIAFDAQFERTGYVYAVYTIIGPEESRRFRLARFREVDGRLGERVVLLDQIPAAARPSAALRAGPDGRLYVGFDAGVVTGRTAALASYNGKILRLNPDGTAPRDQPAGIPVFASGFQSPRGIDWDPLTGVLVVLDAQRRDLDELRIVVDGSSATRLRIPLPNGTGASAVAFYGGTLLPAFTGSLFIAAEAGPYLLRLTFDRRDAGRLVSSERLLEDLGSPIRAVSVSGDGIVYVGTDRAVLMLGPR